MPDFETLLYEERNGVAWVTLNRPEVNNAFNPTMEAELKSVWTSLVRNEDVRCVVLTGAGEKAFCTGIDRSIMDDWKGTPKNPWSFPIDIGGNIGPKSNRLWTPVIVAVNGMACGGAFYLLGEAEFVIASDRATFFDPHVSYGMVAGFESVHLMQKAPFQEVMRMALLGNNERMSAERAPRNRAGLGGGAGGHVHRRGHLGRRDDRRTVADGGAGDGARSVDGP